MFKNIYPFVLIEPTQEDICLSEYAANPIGPHQSEQVGWVEPVETTSGDNLTVMLNEGQEMLCMRIEKRVLPASAVNKKLVQEIKKRKNFGHSISRKEQRELKEDITFGMLPDAPVVEERILGYIDNLNGFVVINTASAKKAEAFLTLLRKSLGTLSVVPINTNHRPDTVMTKWLNPFGHIPTCFAVADECHLEIDNDEKSVVKCKHIDLTSEEIDSLIVAGMSVTKLGLTWNDRVSFVLNSDLTLKRLEFFETQNNDQDDDLTTKFEADFTIMHGEVTALLKDLINAFGGLSDG